MTPIALDLFAGAGGLGEGLESAGIRLVTAVELHPQPSLTYAFNHPRASVMVGDIRKLDMSRLESMVSAQVGDRKLDLIAGGPPCQGFSTAGKKILEDPRNSLFGEFVRSVAHFRPRAFLLENVPGFKKMHGGHAYNEAVRLFGELGYETTDALLNAMDYGIPQGRLRFVMVGWLPKHAHTFEWPEKTHGIEKRDLFTPQIPPVTVEQALEDIAFLEPGWEAHRHHSEANCDFQKERRNGCDLLFNHLASRHRAKALSIFQHIPEGGTISSVPEGVRSAKRTMARMHRAQPSNAVLTLPDDLIHYRHDRIPTVREMARLQSFDDDYVFIGKRTSGFVERRVDVPQYTQVGNAVPPLLGRAIGMALLSCLGGEGRDLRHLDERRARHAWVVGSSGYAGYNLSPAAQGKIRLVSVQGEELPLPISTDETAVIEADPHHDWTELPKSRKGQWAPGVQPRAVPAHVEHDGSVEPLESPSALRRRKKREAQADAAS